MQPDDMSAKLESFGITDSVACQICSGMAATEAFIFHTLVDKKQVPIL